MDSNKIKAPIEIQIEDLEKCTNNLLVKFKSDFENKNYRNLKTYYKVSNALLNQADLIIDDIGNFKTLNTVAGKLYTIKLMAAYYL